MNRAVGLACLVAGVLLLIFGIQESHSLSSHVSQSLSGSPTNRSIWMIVVGAVLAIVGLFGSFRGGTGTRI